MPYIKQRLSTQQEYLLVPKKILSGGVILENQAVYVKDGKFSDIGDKHHLIATYAHISPTELPDHLLMPGFIDSHTHLTQSLGKSLICGEPSEIFKRIWVPLESSLNERMVYLSAKLSALEALRGGFTTAVDAGTRSSGHINAIAQASNETGLRTVIGYICNDLGGTATTNIQSDIIYNALQHLANFEHTSLIHPSLAISIPEVATADMLINISKIAHEANVTLQMHANEHLAAVERSLISTGYRPLEYLNKLGVLGPNVLLAHTTLITPTELNILKETHTASSYNPVASVWKGNAIAPVLQMHAMGIRFGLGTDGTRYDGFRLLDAAESMQRVGSGLAMGDNSCGSGWLWLDAANIQSAEVAGLNHVTGDIQIGLDADFLLIDINRPEFTPSFDLAWELVRYGNRDQIDAVFTQGKMRLWQGAPLDWDMQCLLAEINELTDLTINNADIHKIHAFSQQHRMRHKK